MDTRPILPFILLSTTEDPVQAVKNLRVSYKLVGRTAILAFNNWDEDPREIYDIEEVQQWCQKFIQAGGLSYIAGVGDMPVDNMEEFTPCQLMIAACAGYPGATRVGEFAFKYNFERIEEMERQYRPKDFP